MKRFLFGTTTPDNKWFNTGFLLFRLHIGLSIAIHAGLPKITAAGDAPGWFVKQVSGLGFRFPSPEFWATVATWGEFLGGIFIALGFLTRISAIQLAFQFFVIAFWWYDSPEPLTGMYFQHLLFWGFVLIAITGAGRYSVDYLLQKRVKFFPNKKTVIAAAAMVMIGSTQLLQAQETPVVLTTDMEMMKGEWKGQLTYLDYTSNTEETIPAYLSVKQLTALHFTLTYVYSAEPGKGYTQDYQLTEKGRFINEMRVVEKITGKDGSLKIVLEEQGPDGNDSKPATFHHIILIGRNKLTLTKMVKFEGQSAFFQRNQYSFSKE